jgi:hypothetical protein
MRNEEAASYGANVQPHKGEPLMFEKCDLTLPDFECEGPNEADTLRFHPAASPNRSAKDFSGDSPVSSEFELSVPLV